MPKVGTTVVVLALAAALGCGGAGSRAVARACIDAWNASSNHARQMIIAHRFKVASVSRWRAQPAEAGSVGGSASFGCGYLFHTSSRYVSFSGEWHGHTLAWGVPPTIYGRWSPQQEAAVRDNATVSDDGRLSRR